MAKWTLSDSVYVVMGPDYEIIGVFTSKSSADDEVYKVVKLEATCQDEIEDLSYEYIVVESKIVS